MNSNDTTPNIKPSTPKEQLEALHEEPPLPWIGDLPLLSQARILFTMVFFGLMLALGLVWRNELKPNFLSEPVALLGFMVVLLGSAGLYFVFLKSHRRHEKEVTNVAARQHDVERQLAQLSQRVKEAEQSNHVNQAAVLRLMSELQEMADGDLTVRATVSDDITGAIADSVNYMVGELSFFVKNIVDLVDQITVMISQVEQCVTKIGNAAQSTADKEKELQIMMELIRDLSRLVQQLSTAASRVRCQRTRGQTADDRGQI